MGIVRIHHNPIAAWLGLPLSFLMAAEPFGVALAQPDYYTLKAHGKPIGQVRINHYPAPGASRWSVPGASALNPVIPQTPAETTPETTPEASTAGQNGDVVTEILNTNHFTREGLPFGLNEVSRFVEHGPQRQALSFSYQYELGEQRLLEAQGHLQGNAMDLRLQRENSLSQGSAPIAGERFLFPDGEGMHQVYQAHFADPVGSRFEFQTLALGIQPQIVNSEVVSGKRERLKTGRGQRSWVRRFEVKNPANPTASIQEWRDAQGKLFKAKSTGSDELEMVLAAVNDEPLPENRRGDEHFGNKSGMSRLDVVGVSAVMSNKIAQPRITTEGLYRLSPIQGQHIPWASTVPQGDRQTYERLTDQQLTLKVIQREPKDASVTFPIDGPPEYLASTPYLQSHDPEIEHLALDLVGEEQRAYYMAKRLQHWVYQNIAQKDLSLGFASAKETLARRQGDCTEHAVLLTALNRSLGIPARVAVGLIYLPNGDSQLGRFVYHMWTEIYLGNRDQGEWIPLDATTEQPLADATHIKLADSPLTNVNDLVTLTQRVTAVMGRMKIDVLKALSLSQSVLNLDPQAHITATALHRVDLDRIDLQTLSRQAIQHFKVEPPPAALSKETPEGLFTYGVTALSKGRYSTARDYFRQALAQTHQPIARYRLGEQLASVEMTALAREAFESAARQEPRLLPLAQAWEEHYLPTRDLPESLNVEYMQALNSLHAPGQATLLQQVTAQAPAFAPAWRHLGEITAGAQSIHALQQAIALAPHDFTNLESLGDQRMAQGNYTLAMQAYQQALDQLKSSNAFMHSKPDWAQRLASKQAIAQGSQRLQHSQSSVSGWLTLSQGLLQQKRRDEASTALNQALRLSPGNPDARMLQFRMALQNADWQTLFNQKDTLARLATDHAQAAYLLGLYQMRSRQYEPALQSLKRAIAAQPDEGEAYRAFSQTYLRLAELALQKPGNQAASRSKQYSQYAREALRQGSAKAGQAITQHSLSLQLARLLIPAGHAAEAEGIAQGVLRQNPIHGEAWTILGKAQFFEGDSTAAHASLANALTLNPNDPDTLLLLGHVAKEEGREALAMDFYQQAYKADSFHAEAADAVRTMMNQLRLAGHQPPAYWVLTDDEHDYMVQLLYQGKTLKQQTLHYLQTLNQLPGRAGKISFSGRGVDAAQQLTEALAHMQSQEALLYHHLEQTVVPQRFKTLHAQLLAAVASQMQMLELASEKAPILEASAGESTPEEYDRLLREASDAQVPLNQWVNQLQAHLPDPVFAGLLAEAQLGHLTSLDQEIDILLQTLSNKKEANTQHNDFPPASQNALTPSTPPSSEVPDGLPDFTPFPPLPP